MNIKLYIRATAQEDKPAILKILRNTPEFKPAEVIVAKEVLDSYLDNPSSSGYYSYVAELNSSVVGYVSYGPAPLTEGTWDVYWLVVDRKYQGKSIGKTIMLFVEDLITISDGRLIFIETSSLDEYDKTRSFYYSRGYELVCQVDDFYAPGDHKLILRKRLQ